MKVSTMRIYRNRYGESVENLDARDFPPFFAVCRSICPVPQFQILTLDAVADESRDLFTFKNEMVNVSDVYFDYDQRRDTEYLVGIMNIVFPNGERGRIRFEIRNMFIMKEYSYFRLPVVLIDEINSLPRPRNLLVPLNLEPSTHFNNDPYAIMNHLMDPLNITRRVEDAEQEMYRRANIQRSSGGNLGQIQRLRSFGGAGGGSSRLPAAERSRNRTPSPPPIRQRPRSPPPAPTPAPAPARARQEFVAPSSLQSFTITALINQAVNDCATCPILMVPLDKNTSAVLNCQHIFNREAIQHWIDEGNTTCPVCRTACHICN
jgi:hypothetical protein